MKMPCSVWQALLWFLISAFENTTSTKIKQITAGETLKLRCMGKAENDSADILWSVPEPLNTQERYTISTLKVENINREKWFKRNLNVINIKAIDTGYYTCSHLKKYHSYIPLKAENSTNSPWIKRYYVYAYDSTSLMLPSSNIIPVELGSDLVLPCRASHKDATIQLARIPAIEIRDKQRITYDPAIGYRIRNVTFYDNGFWKCSVSLGKIKDYQRIMIAVSRKKSSIIKTENSGHVQVLVEETTILQHKTLEVLCKINATRDVRFKFLWYFPNDSSSYKIENGEWDPYNKFQGMKIAKKPFYRWSKLILQDPTVSNSGLYTCNVVSPEGVIIKSRDVRIRVEAKPYIKIKRRPSALCGSSICIVRGKTANLSFTVETVPRAVYEWYNGSRRMNETVFSSRAESNRIRIRGSEFVIRNASSIDNGDYALKISTSGSTLYERINLRVRDAQTPQIFNEENQYRVDLGADILIQCNVSGFPYPSVSWLQGQTLVANSSILILNRVKSEFTGNYTCIAENEYGFEKYTALLIVQEPVRTVRISLMSVSIATVVLLVLVSMLAVRRWQKIRDLKRKLREQQKYRTPIIDVKNLTLEEQAESLAYDPKKWEFPRDRLRFGKTLGHGAFGKVVQATAFDLEKSSSCKTIAVKMLKVGSRSSEFNALMSELKILIHLGPHLNIVNLLGACTTKDGPLMMLVEYCRYGNLSVYLRSMRHCYTGNESGGKGEKKKNRLLSEESGDDGAFLAVDEDSYQKSWSAERRRSRTSCGSENTLVSNDGNDTTQYTHEYEDSAISTRKVSETKDNDQNEKKEEKKSLSLSDLLSYSLQVSRGMEFLASKKCIHRDLAARNILLADYHVVKICDFGLARDVYKDPDYVKTGEARLPLKWMAPESIFDKIYSTKSDVWSFGVLLWEIFALGGSPYPGLQIDEDFCHKLRRGVRMGKPDHATDAVYSAMLACWANLPEERPTFTKLCEELSDVLQTEAGHEYMDLMELLDADMKGKLPLRGVTAQQIPQETFKIKPSNLEKKASCSTTVTYTDVEAKVLHNLSCSLDKGEDCQSVNENQDNFDSVIETTQESINLDHLTLQRGYVPEDSGLVASKRLLFADSCSTAASCEPPPLYDDVIALRSKSIV